MVLYGNKNLSYENNIYNQFDNSTSMIRTFANSTEFCFPLEHSKYLEIFRNIFQAHHLENNPTTESIDVEVSAYSVDNNILGRNITRNVLDLAIKQIGRGIGLDGIEKKISTVFPASLRDALARLLHVIFPHIIS